ncbi:MAG: hypothetical protein E3J72_08320 [Planctomycetota bacterium]|nr:MAG: hypothetical protein E3J72_08320 [Planctomycetota bacterium]
MKITLPIKLGIFVLVLFAAVITTCLLWTPVRIRYQLTKLHSKDGLKRISAVRALISMGPKGRDILTGEFSGGEEEVDFWSRNLEKLSSINKQTPQLFLHAVYEGFYNTCDILISCGADVNCASYTTPLHASVEIRNLQLVKLIIDSGADIDAKSPANRGSTPLHLAALVGKKEIVEFLIKRGADVNATNDDGATPLDLGEYEEARKSGMTELLRKHDGKNSGKIGPR